MSLDALTTSFLNPSRMNGTWRQVNIPRGLWYKMFWLGSGRDVFFSKLPLTHQKSSLLPTSCWFWMTFSHPNGFGHPNAIGSVHELLHQIVAGRDGILVIEPGRYAVAPFSLVNKKSTVLEERRCERTALLVGKLFSPKCRSLFWLCRLFFFAPMKKVGHVWERQTQRIFGNIVYFINNINMS